MASVSGAGWLSVPSQSGSATPADPGTVTLVADTSALDPGDYNATVTLASSTTGVRLSIPVSATVTAARKPKMLL